ncbi:MAG: glycerophosphodiester phosphodiesterase [Actinomycetota bacterium]
MLHPYLAYDGPIGFAHRGGAGVHPENTERAFRHAVDLGYRYLETDVHATADGVLVAFHDDRLDRVTDHTGRIIDLTWAEVAEARVDGTDPILRFDEMLERFPDACINIDPKADTAVEPLAETIRDFGVQARVCVTAFSRRRTERVKRLVGSDLCTGGAFGATLETMVGAGRFGGLRDVDVLQVPAAIGPVPVVTRRFVEFAHGRGVHVHVWTIDEPDEMHRLLDLGVDAIMTDRPDVLAGVYADRGHSVS